MYQNVTFTYTFSSFTIDDKGKMRHKQWAIKSAADQNRKLKGQSLKEQDKGSKAVWIND